MRFAPLTALLILLALSPARPARAETVWSGIVIGNKVAEPTPIPQELTRVEGTLKAFFGYNQYQIIGEARKILKSGEEDWTASSKYFSLRIDSKGMKHSAYVLNLQLFQEQKLLLETEANLSKSSPLVIRGPYVGDGQLLLLVVIE